MSKIQSRPVKSGNWRSIARPNIPFKLTLSYINTQTKGRISRYHQDNAALPNSSHILLYFYNQILPCQTQHRISYLPLFLRVLLKHPQNHASGRCSHNHRSQIYKGISNGGKDEDTSMGRPEGTAKCHGKSSRNSGTDDTGRNHAQRVLDLSASNAWHISSKEL